MAGLACLTCCCTPWFCSEHDAEIRVAVVVGLAGVTLAMAVWSWLQAKEKKKKKAGVVPAF